MADVLLTAEPSSSWPCYNPSVLSCFLLAMPQPYPNIQFTCDLWLQEASLADWQAHIQMTLQKVFEEIGWSHDSQIDLTLTDDASIQELNAIHRHKDTPTNILSFPLLEFDCPGKTTNEAFECALLGDLVLAYETVMREALASGLTFMDHATHLLVHGGLHLLGWDHETEDEAEIMENLEVQILQKLGISNPYL